MIRRNIVANACGGAWTVLLTLALIPIQTRLLGVEAYGLLSFMAALQGLAAILDLGLSTTAIREIASDRSPGRRASEALIRTLHAISWLVGGGVGLALCAGAGLIARDWITLGTIPVATAVAAIQLMALTLAARWPVSFFASVLSGVERMDALNLLRIATTTMRLGGGIVVLLLVPDLLALLWWQLGAGVLEVALYAWTCRRLLPETRLAPALASGVVARIWRYSLAVNLIVMQSIVLTVTDRQLLGKLAGAEQLGYYSIAYNFALGISMIQGFITSALMPALSADASSGSRAQLAARYEKGTQLLVFAATLPAALFICFSGELLGLVLRPAVVGHSAPLLAWLGVGFLVSVVPAMPYTLAMATGHTRIPLLVNAAVIAVYLPVLYFLIRSHGGLGAAWVWIGLNAIYLVALPVLVQRQVLGQPVWRWFARAVAPFLGLAALCFGGARLLVTAGGLTSQAAVLGVAAVASALFLGLGFTRLHADMRRPLTTLLRRATPGAAPP